MMKFSSEQLPRAIRKLLELNNFSVEGPVQIHGAEIDLVARHIGNPFASPIYIEATVEYVDNDKYGKDVGKLAMVSQIEPDAKRIIISSSGFSLPVQERAKATRIETLTYDDLFHRFEKFDPYILSFLDDSPVTADLRELARVYEEPDFDDQLGREMATKFLHTWRDDTDSKTRWLVITGEYGTGKTALTKILQLRWLSEYRNNPALPLPIRIELRHFSRQFDARGLLHHFLDHNNLGHISIDFVLSLIRDRRVVLILDGYDEMAQYLHARERRSCLEALADLSAGGAKGIITSRPNFFTEVEELQVFEALYRSLESGAYLQEMEAKRILIREKSIDELLEQFINRFERALRDLSPEQTEALVSRVLKNDAEGQNVVLGLLRRIFRSVHSGDAVSLSGKPIIVSYLLDVVETLKQDAGARETETLTEWQVYKLIVDKLMLRDFERTPELSPDSRRSFLHKAAVLLSKRDQPFLTEDQFRDLISQEFRQELLRLPADSRSHLLEQRFTDLRSSATITRGGVGLTGWRFSHNSLREYLVAEFLITGLASEQLPSYDVPITDAMRMFAASTNADVRHQLLSTLNRAWNEPHNIAIRGQFLTLLWDGLVSLFGNDANGVNQVVRTVAGIPADFRSTRLARLEISSESDAATLHGADFSNAELITIELSGADLSNASFRDATLENVNFSSGSLKGASFCGSLIIDCEFTGAELGGSDFSDIAATDISIYLEGQGSKSKVRLQGSRALGYLTFAGASTDPIPDIFVICNYPSFIVVDKIIEKLGEQSIRQRRGLEQRGAAHQDVATARKFVKFLEREGLIETRMNRKGILYVTDFGRATFSEYAAAKTVSEQFHGSRTIPPIIMSFFTKTS
jgi:uncharacterized protein YjbI with pentapeptide repeats